MQMNAPPVLWHIKVSHFSEKVRWALDYKQLAHVRRAPLPGVHMALVYWLTRGAAITLPLLQIDGDCIADSTDIIAELERRFPEPALYPSDPRERSRALALEEWFDEELADRLGPTLVPYTRLFTGLRYRANDARAAEHARHKVLAAFDRLEAELGEQEYLVGGRFTVADLSAAALLYPLVLPPEGPSMIARMPEPYESFRAPLRERPGYHWVQEIFRRHRMPASADADAESQAGALATTQ
jgi:glutathione S-transferase